MTKTEGIRLVTELEAERILLARGYTKAPCFTCKGAGYFQATSDAMLAAMTDIQRGNTHICFACEGHGWTWQEPAVAQPILP